jgi:hypothetical protein
MISAGMKIPLSRGGRFWPGVKSVRCVLLQASNPEGAKPVRCILLQASNVQKHERSWRRAGRRWRPVVAWDAAGPKAAVRDAVLPNAVLRRDVVRDDVAMNAVARDAVAPRAVAGRALAGHAVEASQAAVFSVACSDGNAPPRCSVVLRALRVAACSSTRQTGRRCAPGRNPPQSRGKTGSAGGGGIAARVGSARPMATRHPVAAERRTCQ